MNTDKVDTEIPAPASGVILKIEMLEGQVAKVGELLAIIGQLGENVESGESVEVSKVESDALSASKGQVWIVPRNDVAIS